MGPQSSIGQSNPPVQPVDTRFVNGMRLRALHWLIVGAIVASFVTIGPWFWKRMERFETSVDYRIPYSLSKDYWLYERRLQQLGSTNIAVLGDSVVWGEYVRADGTLSHFLNEQSGVAGKFVNAGVNGMFPLALEGLVRHYGKPLSGHKVVVHCNVLWMSSPKADLQTTKEERFNHADLVPQFFPRIPCYKAELHHRLAAIVGRNFTFAQWASHLQMAYFEQKNFLSWTLEEDGSMPPRHPNAYKNPLRQITLIVPSEPAVDPERGSSSPRHKAWSTTGQGSTRFDWVELNRSLQWAALQRLVALLQSRGADVFVVVGPFNEHIMTGENRVRFRRLREGIVDWLKTAGVTSVVPATLPSALYADGSHPLTEGYRLLAAQMMEDPTFQDWQAAEATGGSR